MGAVADATTEPLLSPAISIRRGMQSVVAVSSHTQDSSSCHDRSHCEDRGYVFARDGKPLKISKLYLHRLHRCCTPDIAQYAWFLVVTKIRVGREHFERLRLKLCYMQTCPHRTWYHPNPWCHSGQQQQQQQCNAEPCKIPNAYKSKS
jgi:hypothetical protein